MNIYRIHAQVKWAEDPESWYIVIADTEDEARQMIRGQIEADYRARVAINGPGRTVDGPVNPEDEIRFLLDEFDKECTHVEVCELKSGVIFSGY